MLLLLAVLVLLASSALCSGCEAALFSVPLMKAKQLAASKKSAALALLKIRENMNRPIAAVVILNNVANIVGSITVGGIAGRTLGSSLVGVFSAVLTFLVIIFAEIIPKTVGESNAERIALLTARPILALTFLLTPAIWCVERITRPFTKTKKSFSTNEAEIKLMAQIGRQEGIIEDDEAEMIQRIFQLNDNTAQDLMTPRVVMTYLQGSDTLASCEETIRTSRHSRLVVVQNTPDDVTGVVFQDELLIAMLDGQRDATIASYQHDVQRVMHNTRADQLLPIFQRSRQHLAIVLGEYGGVMGVVTLEDVLEVITGQIADETDEAVDLQEVARQRLAEQSLTQHDPTSEPDPKS